MKHQQFDSATLAYIRVTGPYGNNYQPALDKLYQWADSQDVADATCIFIYHDNPEITPAEQCRTDICLMLKKPVNASGDIKLQEFAGGKYATMRKTITDQSQYAAAWGGHIAEIIEMGLEMDERPSFELYHSYDQQNNIADVSFCSALK